MGSNLDNVANLSPDDPPPKTSFFSRLASPLRSRTRNLADFHVRLQEPHRQYSAGDHVKGSVVLYVVKPFRITHLTVALHGYVRVYKNAASGAQLAAVNPAVVSHDGNRDFKYHGNGHASLFQDEQVLCGEGRLKPTRFEFEFDLIFPCKELPSSIDFERGTISYMVTATLTRPTSISPTSSCETKVALIERVDIGLLSPPRERKVTMQTMRKKPKRRKTATSTAALSAKRCPTNTETSEPASDRDSMRAQETSNGSSVNVGETVATGPGGMAMPRTPVPIDLQSEISGESAVSNNSGSNSGRGADASGESVAASKASGHDDREITATVELTKGGCLPGDLLPVKIRVEHNRYMKSMHGIIVTLYRQGRVDYAPPISLFSDLSKEDAKRMEREEYYPKSRTGLGGLSLSSAGSCSVFRKDLSQAVAPLIVDPATLTANITTSIRVPEDVFPSIKGVPGGLISFKYHVEVVVDLGGRLAGPSAGTSQQPTRMGSVSHPATIGGAYRLDLNRLANWNGTIVDTDHLRREKGVISVSFEIIVGTVDNTRSHGKAVIRPSLTVQPPSQDVPIEGDLDYQWENGYNGDHDYSEDHDAGQIHQTPRGYFPPPISPHTPYYDYQDHEPQIPVYIPPPELPRETELTEKERLRQAEQRLLPSRPLQQSSEPEAGPSQPSAPDDAPQMQIDGNLQTNSPILRSTADDNAGEGPSAPTLADFGQSPSSSSHADDKQEVERRRLMIEASAPPEIPEDYNEAAASAPGPDIAGPSSRSRPEEPSAPVLNEDDGYGTRDPYHGIPGPSAPAGGHEPLPKYER
ncbi:Uu.00g039940.m01.CDS01 [Anthostomella pinea]|uniref:Uu.00g039940.m01.CDS01 n=1 Tax=Anthostomella pinea TaxID=933095 RepID=A0AAI8VA45_9PEZI|nr:Uu.00g039940.m01.CDS01 [Anthostomella pinea]